MGRATAASIVMLAVLAGCGSIGSSRLNPVNWFDRSSPAEPVLSEAGSTSDRPLVAEIATLTASPTPGGAILRATGIAATQGYFLGELIPVPSGDPTVLAFEFRAFPPLDPTFVSSPRSREVTVALFLETRDLQGISELRVSGATNARAVRR